MRPPISERLEPCPTCHGDGFLDGPEYVWHGNVHTRSEACPTCDGRGEVEADPADDEQERQA